MNNLHESSNRVLILLLVLICLGVNAQDRMASCSARSRNIDGETFDFVIVGAGSAGTVLANRLSEKNVSVLLLEAGGSDTNLFMKIPATFGALFKSADDWNLDSIPQPQLNGNKIYIPRTKTLGGCGSGNAMIAMHPHKYDMDRIATILGSSDWNFDNNLQLMKDLENNLRPGINPAYHGFAGEFKIADPTYVHNITKEIVETLRRRGEPITTDHSQPNPSGTGINQVNLIQGVRFSPADAFLNESVMTRPNLYVQVKALVDKILFQGNKAKSVRFIDKNTDVVKTVHIRKEVILTAGVFGSPAILLRSGIGPKKELEDLGISVVKNLKGVGKNLQDDPIVPTIWRVNMNVTDSLDQHFDPNSGSTAIIEWFVSKTGPFASNVAEMTGFVKSNLADEVYNGQEDVQYIVGPLTYRRQGALNYYGQEPGAYCVTFGFQFVGAKCKGDVKLASTDPNVNPLVNPNYACNEVDKSRIRYMVRHIQDVMRDPYMRPKWIEEKLPGESVITDEQYDNFTRNEIMSGNHWAGTCAAGDGEFDDEVQSVVNSKLIVHGIQNVRVADAAIMPIKVRANPQFAILLIAAKTAKYITQKYNL